ncbi:hypothetical protein jhhlp_008677 [Lomentospora prolificans]|uniref:CID domain-containing protein n=1 Tax=Lomentospora prolificans TaxID=41688 RepID=A0A2N3MYP7_9PEZI|nr:hypothetical protein jhhlp_008677 [Lomentospora prolificans]
MASPELAISKAAFSAALLRKDPVLPATCTREDVDTFHSLFQDAVRQCSPQNVQKCKRWILHNIVRSPARSAALSKYLAAAASSFDDKQGNGGGKVGPSAKRKRLYVLYLLHDVLYHTKFRYPGNDDFLKNIRHYLAPLFTAVASFQNAPKHLAKVEDLLAFWEEKNLLEHGEVQTLKDIVHNAAFAEPKPADTTVGSMNTSGKASKEAPFVLPPLHGDPSMAWFDLPAANWLPHLTPNSTKPMKPDMIQPLQLSPGPADKEVVDAVKSLLYKVDQIFAKDKRWHDEPHRDLNEMGECVILDEVTGEVIGGETYYGWSREFCRKMKDRRKKPQGGNGAELRGRRSWRSSSRSNYRSRSGSRGRSVSRTPSSHAPKRRRLSESYSRDRSGERESSRRRGRSPTRSASRSRSRSRTPRRSISRDRYHRHPSSRREKRSRTPSPSRTRADRRRDYQDRRSPSPPRAKGNPALGFGSAQHQQPPYGNQAQGFVGFPPNHAIPPPPPNFSGQWPPPPPPPGGPGWNPAMMGGSISMPPIPPPPPPGMPGTWGVGAPHHSPQGQYPSYGRGGGNPGYRGGYGGRGRGRGW